MRGVVRLAVSIAIGLSGCGSSSSGVITGTASDCFNYRSGQDETLKVYQGSVLVASERLPIGTTYKFTLTPGRYLISSSVAGSYSVTMSKGKTVHMNLPSNLCF